MIIIGELGSWKLNTGEKSYSENKSPW